MVQHLHRFYLGDGTCGAVSSRETHVHLHTGSRYRRLVEKSQEGQWVEKSSIDPLTLQR
jgi:hypothetical protein